MSNVLVVGDGPAAQCLVDRTRHHGFEGAVTVLGTGPATVVAAVDRERHRILAHANGAPTMYSYDTLVPAAKARPLIPGIRGLVGLERRLTGGVIAPGPAAGMVPLTGETSVVLGEGPLVVETAASLAARGVGVTPVRATPIPFGQGSGDLLGGILAGDTGPWTAIRSLVGRRPPADLERLLLP
ncbi:hypothetical protein SHKM778_46780 [Streptomyces sp. KM77-8]|uniref:Uncharacterized protein n=1 Tax=Streptomyces haneummycinicus TaxID=3074435 RepID=A0AAT9HLQ8_9ACTN